MKKKLPFLLLLLAFGANAQVPIFDPSMTVSEAGYVYSPSGEGVTNIIDGDVETKFLDFSYYDGLGFTVDLGGYTAIASSMDFTTANDSQERDPMEFQISGSNDNYDFTVIANGTIECEPDRLTTRTFTFDNTEPYGFYEVKFMSQCNTIEQMIQVSEVQLFDNSLSVTRFQPENNEFQLYPNPGNGHFYIKQKGQQHINNVTVTDALGKVVRNVILDTTSPEINMEGIAGGIYFVKIDTDKKSIVKKLIVK